MHHLFREWCTGLMMEGTGIRFDVPGYHYSPTTDSRISKGHRSMIEVKSKPVDIDPPATHVQACPDTLTCMLVALACHNVKMLET